MDKRAATVDSFRNYVKIRKSIPLFKEENTDVINKCIDFENNDEVIDITLNYSGVYHIVINISNQPYKFLEEKYSKYNLFGPYKIRGENEQIILKELGLSAHKCSIFKEI